MMSPTTSSLYNADIKIDVLYAQRTPHKDKTRTNKCETKNSMKKNNNQTMRK